MTPTVKDISTLLLNARHVDVAARPERGFEAMLARLARATGLEVEWRAVDGEEWARLIDSERNEPAMLVSRNTALAFVLAPYEGAIATVAEAGELQAVITDDFGRAAYRASVDSLVAFCGERAMGSIGQGAIDPERLSALDLWYLCP
jgi:hypothetical protein